MRIVEQKNFCCKDLLMTELPYLKRKFGYLIGSANYTSQKNGYVFTLLILANASKNILISETNHYRFY